MLTLTTEYMTNHHLNNVMLSTKAYIPAGTFLESDSPVYLTMEMLKQLLPYFNHANNEYQLSLNEDLKLVHLAHLNQLGEPMDVLSGIDCKCESNSTEKLTVYSLDLNWDIIEPFDSAVYKCAIAVQIIKQFILVSNSSTFAGASIEKLDQWLPRSYKEQPFIKYDERTLIETMQCFLPFYRALGYSDKRKLRDQYPFNHSFTQIISHYESEGNLKALYI
ncbi:MAG: hypothetical protein ABS939_09600 [Psychrobacillus sp.]